MNAVGIIPARWGSTRFPGKSLALLCGKPMIQWVVENSLKARRLKTVIVATDDARIADAVVKTGVKAVMTRADHASGTDRVAEVAMGLSADVVVNIQGDEPLISPILIDELVKCLESGKWDMATACAPLTDEAELHNKSVVKLVCDLEGRALYFSRSVIPFLYDSADLSVQERSVLYWRHIGIYAYTKAFLKRFVETKPTLLERSERLEQLRALQIGGRIFVVRTENAGIGVDTPADVEKVERILRSRRSV
jgi:3-deoxy-manno-octulosonate cytidylyltransferase (CMP-KDO synthetase)